MVDGCIRMAFLLPWTLIGKKLPNGTLSPIPLIITIIGF